MVELEASLEEKPKTATKPTRQKDFKLGWFFLLLPSLVLMFGFFVVPLLWLVRVSLYDRPGSASKGGSRFYDPDTFTFKQYQELLTDSFYGKIILGTLWQAVIITVAVMVLSYPCALIIHRFRPRLKTGALLVVMLPKLTNLLVLTYGLLVMLSNSGIINRTLMALGLIKQPLPMFANLFSVVVAEIVIIAPYPILILVSLFEGIDPALEQAARGMGAGPFRAFYETTFKLTLPGALAGTGISYIWAAGAYIGPVVMGSPNQYTTAVEVFNTTFDANNWPLGAALAVSNVVLVAALLLTLNLVQHLIQRLDRAKK
jgi:ABC-type spermidine/putrescine transport system permease subunit I